MPGRFRFLPLAALWASAQIGSAFAAPSCTPESFGSAIDAAGAALRGYNSEAQPRLKKKLAALKDKKGWSDAAYDEKTRDLLYDERIATLDRRADELLTKIDDFGRIEPGTQPDCNRLGELEASGQELLAVMREKSAYVDAKIDRELGGASAPIAKAESKPAPPKSAQEKAPEKAAEKSTAKTPDAAAKPKASEKPADWDTTTAYLPSAGDNLPGEAYTMPPDGFGDDSAGYTIDEIREASRGFFGTISANLGSVIEHAFRKSGRPTAYVLGKEGGGAFLAGLRYGNGTLFLRSGGTEQVYWHGPSIGYDIGAEDSRTLFLIYRMREPNGIYRRFTGIDGSAYLVGGVGITFLKGGEVIMAPIRSGLGLRLGASIGYVRFTPRPTWNPF